MLADTNLLLRALEPKEGDQNIRARERIRQFRAVGPPLHVLAATILEVAYVLAGDRYGWPRAKIREAIEILVEEPALSVENDDLLTSAAQIYEEHGFDFHDCYLAAYARSKATSVVSFDSDLHKLGVGTAP